MLFRSVLMTRFKETRRKHPLIEGEKGSVEQAIAKERELLTYARQQADYTIDTSHLTAMQLKERIDSLFLDNLSNRMLISCMSFGFKHEAPPPRRIWYSTFAACRIPST